MYHMVGKLLLKSWLIQLSLVVLFLAPVTSRASELLMFERDGCVYCQRWNRDVGPIFDKTDEAKLLPLRRIDIDKQSTAGVTLASAVRFTPTFVVVDEGREIGRITGYINDDAFWGLLGTFVPRLQSRRLTEHSQLGQSSFDRSNGTQTP
ncbi:thioredoxin fold domain-containing protein [Rhodopseudomonas sp. P2A-2r]|nr:thioredoxin fold domain-containing protein [Rhodopseudomonas sp. P2A-2r]UZE52087.1 thioredoxin fold domain-containing protein [Rhodopseudomonas sp. P2A-2r]